MAATLHARSLALTLGRTAVLDDVELQVAPGRRIGLVGPNGVGKSTLLRALAGLITVDAGSISLAPSAATVGYLPQEPERSPDETVVQFLGRRTGVVAAEADLGTATTELATGEPGADDRYADALDRWLALGAADFESRLAAAAAEVGVPERVLDQPMSTLSGGEAARAGLVALLLARFDVILLDEPTNDLDLLGLDRIERWVTEQQAGMVIVSHDREFLRRTVTHVAELDEFTRRLSLYSGGWDAFLAERQVAAQHARERYDEYADRKSNLLGHARTSREWATQGLGKARKDPDEKDKNIKAYRINQSEQLAGKAARTEKAIERLDVVDEPREAWQLRLTFGQAARSGAIVARIEEATASVGAFRLGPISVTIGAGERVGILGHNGSGKSTLLRLILGRQNTEDGTVNIGPSVVIGVLEQSRLQLSGKATLLDAFIKETGFTVSNSRTLLAKFGLAAGDVTRPTSSLSPGERTRAVLALLMANGTNCLVLDEPTNHLDLLAIEQLESALESFRGTLLLVTHDRSLLEHVRLTRRLTLADGRLVADETLAEA